MPNRRESSTIFSVWRYLWPRPIPRAPCRTLSLCPPHRNRHRPGSDYKPVSSRQYRICEATGFNPPQSARELESGLETPPLFAGRDADPVAPAVLGPVQRLVGPIQQRIDTAVAGA